VDTNTKGGATTSTYSVTRNPNAPEYLTMLGTVVFEGPGSIKFRVRGQYGDTWGDWSSGLGLYCREE
jgi:hypothetical protein